MVVRVVSSSTAYKVIKRGRLSIMGSVDRGSFDYGWSNSQTLNI